MIPGIRGWKQPRATINWPVSVRTPEGLIRGETLNISASGAFISLPQRFSLKDKLPLVIDVPDREPMDVAARVVWTTVSGPEDAPQFGLDVHFVDISTIDRTFLIDVTAKHLERKMSQALQAKRKPAQRRRTSF